MRKVFVRFLAFSPEQREMLRAFLANDFVGGGSLLLQDLIFTSSLALENVRNGRAWHGRAIGRCARCRQHLVRTAPSPADNGIGRFIDRAVLKSLIRFFALGVQALVSLFALKAPVLVFWGHRCREVYTSLRLSSCRGEARTRSPSAPGVTAPLPFSTTDCPGFRGVCDTVLTELSFTLPQGTYRHVPRSAELDFYPADLSKRAPLIAAVKAVGFQCSR